MRKTCGLCYRQASFLPAPMSKNTRSSRIATALATFLLLAMLATLGLAIWFARDQSIDEWRAQLDNLSLVLAEQGAQEIKFELA